LQELRDAIERHLLPASFEDNSFATWLDIFSPFEVKLRTDGEYSEHFVTLQNKGSYKMRVDAESDT
jgi:hypothetical protein